MPLFPLQGVFLFPGQIVPLHIFEPRYKQMIEDLLDGPGRLVIGSILDDQKDLDVPGVLPVAGLGEIARHQRLEDGRFLILLFGLSRVTVAEADSERLYRRVRITEWEEEPATAQDSARLRSCLVAAIRKRTGYETKSLDGVSTGQLADVLAQCLPIPRERMEEIYAEPRVGERAERVLAEHDVLP
ncbi:MAG: LON peptidase substrate-binding domain-containing protein [Planctomycetota bacterium]